MRKAIRYSLVLWLLMLTTTAYAQVSNFPGLRRISHAGAPSGSCSPVVDYVDTTTGNYYICKAGVWIQPLVGAVTDVTASLPLSSSGGATPNLSISQAGAGADGYLSSIDWSTFNAKQPVLSTQVCGGSDFINSFTSPNTFNCATPSGAGFPRLDQVLDPNVDKAFDMGVKSLSFGWDSTTTWGFDGAGRIVADVLSPTSMAGITLEASTFLDGATASVEGIDLKVSNYGTTAASLYALFINNGANYGAGTIPNNFGIFLDDQTVGVTNYAIKTGLGLVDFGDAVKGASTINAVTGFQVNGAATLGNVLRGNGTNFVSATLACADLSDDGSLCASSGPLPSNEAGAANNFLTAYNSGTGAYSKAQPTWANIDKTVSSVADIATRTCATLSDSGTGCSGVTYPGLVAHKLLSTSHTGTTAADPVRGDIIIADLTPSWTKLALGAATAGKYAKSNGTDVVISTGSAGGTGACPGGQFVSTINADAAPGCGTPTATLPSGLIVFIASGTCPTGFTEVAGLSGKFVLGTTAAGGDVGTTGGSDTITPTVNSLTAAAQTVNSLTAAAQTVSSLTAAAQGFTGDSTTVPALAVGTIAFTGTPSSVVVNHLHTLATGTGATGNFSQVLGTVDTSSGGTGGTPTQTALGTLSGNPTAGGASSYTPAGSMAGSTATGALTPLGHNATSAVTGTMNSSAVTGTMNSSAVTGTLNSFDNRPAFIKLIGCSSN